MTNENGKSLEEQKTRKFDLEERTAKFGEAVIAFAKSMPRDVVTLPLIDQFVRSGTGIGANYCEADDAVSKREFRVKINSCKKEARETKYWLRMIVAGLIKKNSSEASMERSQRATFDLR